MKLVFECIENHTELEKQLDESAIQIKRLQEANERLINNESIKEREPNG